MGLSDWGEGTAESPKSARAVFEVRCGVYPSLNLKSINLSQKQPQKSSLHHISVTLVILGKGLISVSTTATKSRTMIMMKQKIVLEVCMPDSKCRKKARKIVAMTEGLISMAIEADKNKLVIVGIGIDAAILATVEEVKSAEKIKEEEAAKKKKEDEEAAKNKYIPWSYNYAPPAPFSWV